MRSVLVVESQIQGGSYCDGPGYGGVAGAVFVRMISGNSLDLIEYPDYCRCSGSCRGRRCRWLAFGRNCCR